MSDSSGTDNSARQADLPAIQSTTPQSVVELIKKFGPAAYGMVVGVLYVCGFLVLNSNLAKHGVLDVEFVNARYFLAAASFVFYSLCFYLFAGRAVFFAKKWLGEDLELMRKRGVSTKWFPILFFHSQLHALFFLCLSSALFTSTAIGSAETTAFYLVLLLSFLVLYPLDVKNLDIRYPRITEIVKILVKSGAVGAFFALGSSKVLVPVFFSYLTIFLFINMVLDSLERHGVTQDRVIFSSLYAAVVVLGSAISFGSLFYGQVSPKLGGARPQHVSIGLDEAARSALPASVMIGAVGALEGDLIHQTSSYTYVVAANHTIRLRSTDVVTLTTSQAPDPSEVAALQKLFTGSNKAEEGKRDMSNSQPAAPPAIK